MKELGFKDRQPYFKKMGKELHVDLWYPRAAGSPSEVHVGLVDVRAADGLRITYDFDRDGWRIEQAQRFTWLDTEEPDPQWKEVAFVQAWGSQSAEDKALGGDE